MPNKKNNKNKPKNQGQTNGEGPTQPSIEGLSGISQRSQAEDVVVGDAGLQALSPRKPKKIKESEFLAGEMGFVTLIMQVKVLLWKNFTIFKRKKKVFVFMLSTPLMICFMFQYMQGLLDQYGEGGIMDHELVSISKMNKCTPPIGLSQDDCTTVGYSIIGDKRRDRQGHYEHIHTIMRTAADSNDLEFGKDVKLLTIGKSKDLIDYLESNMNRTTYAVLFCDQEWHEELELPRENAEDDPITFDFYMPCHFEHDSNKSLIFYSLFYNFTLLPSPFLKQFNKPYASDVDLLKLKLSMDNAILEMKAKEKKWDFIPEIENVF